jgi:hypothetical protein
MKGVADSLVCRFASKEPWLVMLCPYFGHWPAWINFFIESCKWNPEVRWRLYTDCGDPENHAENVDVIATTFADYKAFVRTRLGLAFDPPDPYKICDVKPALGRIHEQDIAGYPFFGYGDIDVIYGDLASFYSKQRFANLDVVSAHPERLSGHFAVLRNTPAMRNVFERISGFDAMLQNPKSVGTDEYHLTRVLMSSTTERKLFVERHSTVLSPRGWYDGTMDYPQRWFWRAGHLTTERDPYREFLYLHFMRWQSARWISSPPAHGEAAWVGRDIIKFDWRRAATEGFCISPEGFTPI